MPMLRHRIAAALLFALHQRRDTFIGLPDVVRDEAELYFIEKLESAQRQLSAASGEVRQILGHAREIETHAHDEVPRALSARLAELGTLVQTLPVTDADLVEAGRMVIKYQPPSTRSSQQFRDSVIWRIVARMAHDHHVILITGDEGFYAAKSGNELAEPLAVEIRDKNGSVTLHRDVEELLGAWSSNEPPLATEALRDAVAAAVSTRLDDLLRSNQLELAVQDVKTADIEAFLTEVHDELAVSGRFKYYLADPSKLGGFRAQAIAHVDATASVGAVGPTVRQVAFDHVVVDAVTEQGVELISESSFVRGRAAVLGSRTEPYRLHEKLDLPRALGNELAD